MRSTEGGKPVPPPEVAAAEKAPRVDVMVIR